MPDLPTRAARARAAGSVPRPALAALLALASAGAVLLATPRPGAAQVNQPWPLPPAAPLPLGDPVYRVLDEVLALVPVPGAVVGQRPYARTEIARIVRAVDRELLRRDAERTARRQATVASNPGSYVSDAPPAGEVRAATLVQLLREAYDVRPPERDLPGEAVASSPWQLRWRAVDAVQLGVWGTRAPGRRILPVDNGVGAIDAVTVPSLDARAGRPAVAGATWNVETMHSLGVGEWLALVAQPRLSYLAPYGAGQTLRVEPQRLFARARLANVAVQAGMDELNWGQGGARSLLVSSNARPLRSVMVSSDTAFALPWVLSRLGRWRAGVFVADLGKDQRFPGSKLAAYKVSLTPVARLELGAGLLSEFGGRGAPPMTTRQRAADLFPFVTWLNEGSDRLASNKVATLDARLRVPEWRGTTLYWEMAVDDFDLRRVESMLREDSGHLLGLSIARLRGDGTLSLDVRAHDTSLRLYRHYQFTSGLTYRDQVIGDPLGPNARALYGTLTWRPALTLAVDLELAAEERDPSLWTTTVDGPDDAGWRFVRVSRGTIERRQRAVLGLRSLPLGPGIAAVARGGAEVVRNEAFVADGRRRAYAVGELGVQLRF
jgi:hypothetical protein